MGWNIENAPAFVFCGNECTAKYHYNLLRPFKLEEAEINIS